MEVFFFFFFFFCSQRLCLLVNLPRHFLVWAASDEAKFLKNKFVFANWDVDEMKAREQGIAGSPELMVGLNGFPRNVDN